MLNKRNLTFIITDKCNLRCTYCYEKNKQYFTMTDEVVKQSIIFTQKWVNSFGPETEFQFDFIGGEPLLATRPMSLILEGIVNLMKDRKNKYVFLITTNGTQFTEKNKALITSWKQRDIPISLGISLDGTRAAHNRHRCNSFDDIIAGWNWWFEEFADSSSIKSTFMPDTINELFSSFKFFVEELGVTQVRSTPVIGVGVHWTDDDILEYKKQIRLVADYMLSSTKKGLYYQAISDGPISSVTAPLEYTPRCGCGTYMLAIGYDGKLYPCTRFFTPPPDHRWTCGDIWNGVDKEKIKPFITCHIPHNEPCASCEIKKFCFTCTADNFLDTGSIFERNTAICEITKSNIEINQYYYDLRQNKGVCHE